MHIIKILIFFTKKQILISNTDSSLVSAKITYILILFTPFGKPKLQYKVVEQFIFSLLSNLFHICIWIKEEEKRC